MHINRYNNTNLIPEDLFLHHTGPSHVISVSIKPPSNGKGTTQGTGQSMAIVSIVPKELDAVVRPAHPSLCQECQTYAIILLTAIDFQTTVSFRESYVNC